MKDIKCPNCGTVFQVDESDYAAIAAQVRTAEFDEEISRRMKEAKAEWTAKQEADKLRAERLHDKQLADKGEELNTMRQEITRLNSVISSQETTKKAELTELAAKKDQAYSKAMADKEKEILDLNAKLEGKDNEFQIRMLKEKDLHKDELQKKTAEIEQLKTQVATEKLAAENRENNLNAMHEQQLKLMQEEIERVKDYKAKLSTKMIGESLEQYCQMLFETAQSNGLYPNAYFNKDNTVVEGSKGDFIFRDYVDDNEYVSIMFEMKNEMDGTQTKHRNDDFLDKLHKDRQRKNCEYAVLVSMLEQENELYNAGIVDKSHKYPKMIVIRPQFFMPVIRLISEAAKKGFVERLNLMDELEEARSQTLDFSKFEEKIGAFKENMGKSLKAAQKKFNNAMTGIDKTIKALEDQISALRTIKQNLEDSGNKLNNSDEMLERDLTVKKLTHGIPNIKKQIEEAGKLIDN